MKTIWLVNPYGPIEGENWREYSFNQFGKYLSGRGFRIIWWTANFSHHFKKYRSEGWKDIQVNENFIIRLVPTNSYKKNFSFGRMRKDWVFASNAMKGFGKADKPDIIIAAENPILMGKPAYTYAKKNNIPIVYDQMDIWPEFFVKVLGKPFGSIANVLLKPVYKKRREIYGQLDGAVALGKHYLEFMFDVNATLKTKPSALVYNGIDVQEFRTHLNENIMAPKLSNKKDDEIWCIFAGTLGPSYDIKGILECAEMCKKKGMTGYKFIIAGSGPLEEDVIYAESRLDNLIYVGKLLPEQLIPIYGKCDIGLATYSAGSNVDMCDKFYDYTAAGLAVVNSLKGEISEHVENEKLGINYEANNSESLMSALVDLYEKETLRLCKKNSYNIAMHFDKDEQNRKLIELIKKILGEYHGNN